MLESKRASKYWWGLGGGGWATATPTPGSYAVMLLYQKPISVVIPPHIHAWGQELLMGVSPGTHCLCMRQVPQKNVGVRIPLYTYYMQHCCIPHRCSPLIHCISLLCGQNV